MSDKITDYISGVELHATPEEVEATQVFSKILVEDYKYPKEYIQTRPQYHVKARPSDRKKEYPVDIAVFNSTNKNEDTIYLIVECKKKNRKDGRNQLEDYMRFSKARLGVWFNGDEKLTIQKIEKDGRVEFEEISDIPSFGQRVEDVGKYLRKDLEAPTNLKTIFKVMRNYLAPNAVGVTRDESLAQQLINLIFCKIYDEKYTKPADMVNFRSGVGESVDEVKNRILKIFEGVKERYPDVIESDDNIVLDSNSISYVVGQLQRYCLLEASRDAVGDAFEVFIGHALKGAQGQFFTPKNVVKMIVNMMDIQPNEKIIDPFCGSGGFLVEALKNVWNKSEKNNNELGWPEREIEIEKQKIAIENFRGIDKDDFLSKVCKAQMAILGDGRGGVFCENSLDIPSRWQSKTQDKIALNKFDVVITNPPYGSKIKIDDKDILKQFDVGLKWKKDKKTGHWMKDKMKENDTPQNLAIERCMQFLKPGGRMALVLPDGIYGNDSLGYIRRYLLDNGRVLAVIDLPKETFMPHTSTKTTVILMHKYKDELDKKKNYPVFMAVCETCGHDRRGNLLENEEDDILAVSEKFKEWRIKNGVEL
ncbi:MAG: N-6 DNA methylase [Clostridia bacterium]|nr:N-6 DNA methylase [Clostridia bacterium]